MASLSSQAVYKYARENIVRAVIRSMKLYDADENTDEFLRKTNGNANILFKKTSFLDI